MATIEKKLYIVIGCDTDPDRPDLINNVSTEKLSWRGLTDGIPATKETVNDITDENNRPPVFTWLLRADEQIKALSGDYNSVLSENRGMLSELDASGDEIGWHPHFFKYDDEHRIWYQELYDHDWQCEMLELAYSSFNKIFPEGPRSVRTGWIYHNNHTMKKLDELGVKVDFSAVPGLRTRLRKSNKFPYNIYDWHITPRNHYHPSILDYRRPAGKDENVLSILEVPNFTSNSFFWGIVAGAQMARKMKDPVQIIQAIKRPTFWVNLTGSPGLYAPIIKTLERELKSSRQSRLFFVTYFHADELIQNNSRIYSRDNLRQNLLNLSEVAAKLNIPYRFIRACDIPELISD